MLHEDICCVLRSLVKGMLFERPASRGMRHFMRQGESDLYIHLFEEVREA